MSFVTTQTDMMTAASGNLEAIGSTMAAESAAAADPTVGVIPAAADQVSALTASQFSAHAAMYQVVSAMATAIHEQVVSTLASNAASYAATEAANVIAAS